MNALQMIDLHPILEGLAWALLHFVWQGALIGLMLAGLLALVNRADAELRYLLASGALLLMLLAPLGTFLQAAGISTAAAPEVVQMVGAAATAADPVLPPMTGGRDAVSPGRLSGSLQPALAWILAAWIAGVLTLSVRLAGGWYRVRQLRSEGVRPVSRRWRQTLARIARDVGVSKEVRLVESIQAPVPMVVGWLRPVVLVPTAAFAGLSPQHLEAILAHELAHVRRHDVLVNFFQTLAETFLFYHPAVWWVSRQVRSEREHCCDDLGARACGDRLVYARALAEMEGLRHGVPALGVAVSSGGSLLRRIRRLFEPSEARSERLSARRLGGAASILVLVVATAATALATRAQSEEFRPPEPPEPPEPVAMQAPSMEPSEPEITDAPAPPEPPVATLAMASPSSPTTPEPPQVDGSARGGPETRSQEVDPVASLSDEQVEGLSERGLDRALLEELRERGNRRIPLERLDAWTEAGLDRALVEQLGALGVESVWVDEVLHLVWYGVDGASVQALRETGYDALSVTDLVLLGRYGVDAALVEGFRAVGLDDLTVEDLTSLGRYGVSPELAGELVAAGLDDLRVETLVSLERYGVDGSFVRALADLGYDDLSSEELISLERYGVEPAYVEKVIEAGYPGLEPERLIAFRKYGVDEEVLERLKSQGDERPGPDRLIEMARYGQLDTLPGATQDSR